MFIFITPRIVRNPADISAVTLNKEDDLGRVLPAVERELHKVDNPEHSVKLTLAGYKKLQANDLEAAKEYFLKALDTNPANPYALMNLGVVYEKEGNPDEAMKMYQAVVATGTDDVADTSSDPDKTGTPLMQLAEESIQRIMATKER